MKVRKSIVWFALCVRGDGSEDLEQRKLYQILPDRAAAREGYLRIVDESGEDHLYSADLFVAVKLRATVATQLMLASRPTNTTRSSAKLGSRTSRH